MEGIKVFSSGDYAGFKVDDLRFYYGYEVVENPNTGDDDWGDEEWCFQVTDKGKEVFRRTTSQLDEVDVNGDETVHYLLAGVAMWIKNNKK